MAVATGTSPLAAEPVSRFGHRRWLPDLFGIGWVLVAGLATLIPALIHGIYLGPYDLLSEFGVSHQAGVVVHNQQAGDQILLMIPWTHLAWTQVHHGQLPLWNPYSVLGEPLAFNWQSGAFGLQALVGYLVPVQYAYTVQILVTLVVAGTGAYFLCRVLRLSVVGSAMGATVFELSGAFMGLLGWPVASVMSWAGWIFGAVVLVIRGEHRLGGGCLLAISIALAIYAGQPEALVLLIIAAALFALVLLIFDVYRPHSAGSAGKSLSTLALGSVGGVALGAPLLLPATQLGLHSARVGVSASGVLPANALVNVLFQGFDGLPIHGNIYFGSGLDYINTVSYIGIIAIVLAGLALVSKWGRPEVVALGVVALSMCLVVYVEPVDKLLNKLPVVGGVLWFRALGPMEFALAILSGIGIDVLLRNAQSRRVLTWVGGSFALSGVVIAVIWFAGRGHHRHIEAVSREDSFLWPVLDVVIAVLTLGLLAIAERRRWRPSRGSAALLACLALLGGETAFLVTAGAPIWSSSSTYLPTTHAEKTLIGIVGSSVVGLGTEQCFLAPGLGIRQDLNVAYGVQEFAVEDPQTPVAYYNEWLKASGQPGGDQVFQLFCPAVTSAALAKEFGISYVVQTRGYPGPTGGVFVTDIDGESLYRIPGAALATLQAAQPSGQPVAGSKQMPISVTHPDPASERLTTNSSTYGELQLRLTNVPGWQATIDGHPLALQPSDGIMLEARIPPGHHVIELHYWPTTFTVGLIAAACGAIGLVGAVFAGWRLRRKRATVPYHAA